jgi:hypothetical protein
VSDNETAPGPLSLRVRREWPRAAWRPAALHAALVCLFVLGLFTYWFGIADRYAVFLYNHMGATPFDSRTNSRYWMAGLVAAGVVLVLYTTANWFAARIYGLRYAVYSPPAWWQAWLLCAIPLGAGIPAITMTVNSPTLPPAGAAACAAVAWMSLGLALAPGRLAAQQPAELGWLALGGMGLMPALLLLRAPELPARGLIDSATAWRVALGGFAAGAIWLVAVSVLRVRRHPPMGWTALFLSGLAMSYLLLPLVHYGLLTPPHFRYISAASNFFAFNPVVQLLDLCAAAILAAAAVQFQRRLRGRTRAHCQGRTT